MGDFFTPFLHMKSQLRDKINQFRKISENIRSVPEVLDKVVSDNKDVLLSLNRDQMLLGRDADGEMFKPSYLQDPYFKTQAAAQSYARMKYALEPSHKALLWTPVQLYPDKDRNTANLIVTGLFQNGLFITAGGGSFDINSSYVASGDINRKYKGRVFGIAPKSKEYFFLELIKPTLLKHLGV